MTRDEAIKILSTRDNQGMPITWQNGFAEAYNMAIEALERKRGEWIDRSDGGRILNPWWESYECSVCGSVSHNWNYCPNCGADMRG